ncbi:hypothetical protein B0H17DRAFT_1136412 [Mycena rosella]|uniref:Uncharacterized protein n=1 Tax=Mycena rosella TaxID=1033263 RepID=A0AAD7GGQ2_MYCRO|nr:hypothetical protein B0H17DRAFT_1136412 [Mycena rosella]
MSSTRCEQAFNEAREQRFTMLAADFHLLLDTIPVLLPYLRERSKSWERLFGSYEDAGPNSAPATTVAFGQISGGIRPRVFTCTDAIPYDAFSGTYLEIQIDPDQDYILYGAEHDSAVPVRVRGDNSVSRRAVDLCRSGISLALFNSRPNVQSEPIDVYRESVLKKPEGL